MSKTQLSYVSHNGTVLAIRGFNAPIPDIKEDVTEAFLRCVVRYCTEEVEFVVDGMRFKATCERI